MQEAMRTLAGLNTIMAREVEALGTLALMVPPEGMLRRAAEMELRAPAWAAVLPIPLPRVFFL